MGRVAIIGSGFAGSLLARILAVQGHEVFLLERGTHPRFAIGESTTPLANLSLERIARRYGLEDCFQLAAHGRWLRHHPGLRRGLKRGFTFYRHHAHEPLSASQRLMVAASPTAAVADTHWLRADVDHHFVRAAVDAGVDYRDRTDIQNVACDANEARLRGMSEGAPFDLRVDVVVDASGPGGVLARALDIPSRLDRALTNSALVFSHFSGVRLMADVRPDLPAGPYEEDWAAVHHIIDGGWMYSLRFDDGMTSAGFTLSPRGLAAAGLGPAPDAGELWGTLRDRYPTINAAFADATPLMPLVFRPRIQHRLSRAAGTRWVMLPHAFAFTDPLFSTGIAWALRAVERLALGFEEAGGGVPSAHTLERYAALLDAEADQIDRLVAGAYHAMTHFELFAAQAMIYFATVSYAEAYQRAVTPESEPAAWSGFLGVGDAVLHSVLAESHARLDRLTEGGAVAGSPAARAAFTEWVRGAIAPRNIGGFGDPARRNLYPVDLGLLVDNHELLGLRRDALEARLPRLRGLETWAMARGATA